jgi:hypothetical protein
MQWAGCPLARRCPNQNEEDTVLDVVFAQMLRLAQYSREGMGIAGPRVGIPETSSRRVKAGETFGVKIEVTGV